MKQVSSSAFTQRPVDSSRNPRVPLTEWEYNEKHGGDPLGDKKTSESSGLCEFSISSDSFTGDSVDDFLDDLERCQKTEVPDQTEDDFLISADPRKVGNALQGDLKYLADSHKESKQRLEQIKSATKSSISSYKYGYFEDLSDNTSGLRISMENDFISSPSRPSTGCIQVADEMCIDTKTNTMNRPEFDISDDSELEKSISASVKIESIPFKPKSELEMSIATENGMKTSELLQSVSIDQSLATSELLRPVAAEKSVTFLDQNMKTSELLKSIPSRKSFTEQKSEVKSMEDESVSVLRESMKTSELLKPVMDEISVSGLHEQPEKTHDETSDLLKTESVTISDDFEIEESTLATQKSQTKSATDAGKKTVRISASNPPSMFAKYMEEHPPPPKPKIEAPTKFKYVVSEIEDKAPEMWKKNPPKQSPKKMVEEDSGFYKYKPKKIIDKAPSCVNPEKYKKKRQPSPDLMEIADDAAKQFDVSDDTKAVADYKRRQKIMALIDERMADPSIVKEKKERKVKKNIAKKAFYEPAETKAVKLRNQTVRQQLAVIHEAKRVEQEEAEERAAHARAVGLRLRPELKKLAEEAEAKLPKKDKYKQIGGRFNDPKAVETLEKAARNVKATEEILRRNDRSLILRDCGNKRRKEAMAESKRVETEALQSRKTANERLMRKWKT